MFKHVDIMKSCKRRTSKPPSIPSQKPTPRILRVGGWSKSKEVYCLPSLAHIIASDDFREDFVLSKMQALCVGMNQGKIGAKEDVLTRIEEKFRDPFHKVRLMYFHGNSERSCRRRAAFLLQNKVVGRLILYGKARGYPKNNGAVASTRDA